MTPLKPNTKMANLTACEKERNRLNKIIAFQLPHSIQKWGIGFVLLSAAAFILSRIFDMQSEALDQAIKMVFIASLLLTILCKENDEDELVKQIRSQAFVISVIFGVLYMLLMPWVTYGAELLVDPTPDPFKEMSAYNVVGVILCYQLVILRYLKRMR